VKKKALFNRSFVTAICILGLTACSSGGGEGDSSEEYGSLSQAYTVWDTLPTSGTKTVSIASYPGDDNIVIMNSPSAGNWKFEIYGSPIGWDGCYTGDHVVFTFWRQGGGSWNEWPGGGGICWPTSFWSTNLNSGSSNILYKFEVENYVGFPDTPYGQTVYLKFTKL
jgi:hypothetical protein